VKILSVLTCESKLGVCVMAIRNSGFSATVEMGEATGVIAAHQSASPNAASRCSYLP